MWLLDGGDSDGPSDSARFKLKRSFMFLSSAATLLTGVWILYLNTDISTCALPSFNVKVSKAATVIVLTREATLEKVNSTADEIRAKYG
jgi:hypothetical protein